MNMRIRTHRVGRLSISVPSAAVRLGRECVPGRRTRTRHIRRTAQSRALGRRVLMIAVSLLLGSAAAAAQPPTAATAATVHVYSAGSIRGALTTIAQSFEQRTGAHVAFTYGSSGLLRERIQHGADADVFTSADMGQPERLAAGGGWSKPVAFARNDLCVLARKDLHATPANLLQTLLDPKVRIGTSTPGADPSGDYAWKIFRRADAAHPGAYKVLNAKAMRLVGGGQKSPAPAGQNAVAWYFAQRKIDVFVSYCGGARRLAATDPALTVVTLPPSLAVAGTNGVTVRDSASSAAHQFARELLSPAAQQALRANGFSAP